MSDWQQITLGRLFSADNSKLGVHKDEPIVMSLSKYDGFVRADDYFDKRIASEKLDDYKTVEPGEWAYSTIHIDEGSIARNNLGETGVISPMYTTLRWRGNGAALPEYAELMVRSPQMLAEYANRAQGTVNRRRSLPFKTFSEIPINVPPLSTQKRIVEIIGAIDNHVTALDTEIDALSSVESSLRRNLFSKLEVPTVPAGEKFEMRLGRQKSARQSVGDHVQPYVRAANIGVGTLDLSDLKTMNFEPREQEMYAVLPEDVLLVEGGSVGQAALWAGEVDGFVGFDKHVIRIRAREGISTPQYALQWCHWARESGQFAQQATGITIKALGFSRASSMGVPDLTIDHQTRLTDSLATTSEQVAATRAEANRLRRVRATLLVGLLDRTIELASAETEA